MGRPLYLALLLGLAVLGSVLGVSVWLTRDRPGAKPLTLFVVAGSLWAVAEGIHVASVGPERLAFWKRVALTLSTVVPLAWLVTVLDFTGRRRWLTRRRLGLLTIEPACFTFLLWTNGSGHGLVWESATTTTVAGNAVLGLEFGIGFWAHQTYTYLVVAAGAALLVLMLVRPDERLRTQGTVLLWAAALPMVVNGLYLFRVLPWGLDPTANGFVLAGIVASLVTVDRDLGALAPVTREVGRDQVLDEMDARVVIVDGMDRIVDANPSAIDLLGHSAESVRGRALSDELPGLRPLLDDSPPIRSTVELEHDGRLRHYDVRISSLSRDVGPVSGRLVSLRDVTERHQREERLDVLNRLLRHNIRNEMNVVRGNAELVSDRVDDAAVERRLERIVDNVDTVLERSDKVGVLSRTLESGDSGPIDLARQVREVVRATREAEQSANVETDLPETCWVAAGPALSVVWRELLDNAVEHHDGDPTVRVTLECDPGDGQYAHVRVADDGPGLREAEWRAIAKGRETPLEHASGLGLWMVHWVVRSEGGSVAVEDTETGTTIRVRVPLAEGRPESTGTGNGVGSTPPPAGDRDGSPNWTPESGDHDDQTRESGRRGSGTDPADPPAEDD